MKKLLLLIAGCMINTSIMYGQGDATCYRIYLSDKNQSTYSIDNPSEFLSPRAIAKRNRFQIPVTIQDIPVNTAYKQSIVQLSDDIEILAQSKWQNCITVYCPDSRLLDSIISLSFVDSILPVANYRRDSADMQSNYPVPVLPSASEEMQKRYDPDYNTGFNQIAMHNGQHLHYNGFRGEGMLIAVVDGGWKYFNTLTIFSSLYANNQIKGAIDLIPWENNPYSGGVHGTHVTSVMAGNIVGTFIGTAPNADYFFIRSENPYSEQLIEEDLWANAAEIADSIGADVLQSSLGYTDFNDFPQAAMSYADCDGITSIASRNATIATQKGIIVCVSAGNTGDEAWHYIGRPADAPGILTVGAIAVNGTPASFSSLGPSYDQRIKPDVVAVGKDTWIINAYAINTTESGTSFASPIISGLSACLWQALPSKTAPEIIQIIKENSNRYDNPNNYMGYGIPDFFQAYLDNDSVGINNYAKNDILLFPNPCTSSFVIMNNNHDFQYVKLYDLAGKLVMSEALTDSPVDISSLKEGLYIVILVGDKNIKRGKIVKQNM